ncbi:MAG: PEP-CTERM sorting domain-containing protein [Phycisphaerae bacterium]|nr:PEP-CTERM sorting domain-containing protein [Phycisphaerae bacterium]
MRSLMTARRNVSNVFALCITTFVISIGVVPALGADAQPYTVYFDYDGVENAKQIDLSVWIPEDVPLRGMLYMVPCLGGDTRWQTSSEEYQMFARALGLGIIGHDDRDGWPGEYEGTTTDEIRGNVQKLLDGAAVAVSCPQIRNAPIAFQGFSKGGWMDAKLASCLPERTICFVADKSGSWLESIPNEATSVPGLFIAGEKDSRVSTYSVYSAYMTWRSEGAQTAYAVDWEVGHWSTQRDLPKTYIAECMSLRYPEGQLPSTTQGDPLLLNPIDYNSGWLVERSFNWTMASWKRSPEVAPVNEYTQNPNLAGWLPNETMAMVLCAKNGVDPDTTVSPIDILPTTAPQAGSYAYEAGQTIELLVTNNWLNPNDITRVEVFHEDELIGDFTSLSSILTLDYTVSTRGVHTFWTRTTYLFNGEPTFATDFYPVVVVPEPATLTLLGFGALIVRRRKT